MIRKIRPRGRALVLAHTLTRTLACTPACTLAGILACVLSSHFASASPEAATGTPVEWFRLQLHGNDAGFQEKRITRNGYHSVSVFLIERDGEALALSQEEAFCASALPRLDWEFVLAPGDTLRRSALFAPDSIRVFDGRGRPVNVVMRPESLLLPDEREAAFLRAAKSTSARPADLDFHRFLPELETVVRILATREAPSPNGTAADVWNLRIVDAPHLNTREWRDPDGRLVRWESRNSGWSAERTSTRPAVPEDPAQLAGHEGEPTVGFRFLSRTTYESIVYRIHGSDQSPTLTSHPTVVPRAVSGGTNGEVTEVLVQTLDLSRSHTRRVGDPMAGHAVVGGAVVGSAVPGSAVAGDESRAEAGSFDEGRPGHEALAASEWVDYDHPAFLPLLEGIDTGTAPQIQAEHLVRLVHQRLRPSAGSHFAKASTALVQGHGDCTEFAVVLAALARASGLPTRFVAGWVGIDNSMGYHLWNEVYIRGTWFGLDAALNRFPTDARYVPMVVSSPGRDDPVQLFRELAAFGSVRIEVVAP